jgi:hypothetical protein
MKKCLASCLLLSTPLVAESSNVHVVLSSFFYRNHTEGKYQYEITVIGLQYHYMKDDKMNAKVTSFVSFKDKNIFHEHELSLYYHHPFNKYFYIFPISSHKFVRHHYENVEESSLWASKAKTYLGTGIGFKLEKWLMECQVEGFKDLQNKMTMRNKEKEFSGKFFSNPFGYRVKVYFKTKAMGKNCIGLSGFWGQAFDKSYYEFGSQASIEWGF